MSAEDELGQETDRMVRAAMMGMAILSEKAARSKDRKMRALSDAQVQAERDAAQTTRDLEHARREQARALNNRVRRPEFWKNASTDQVDELVAFITKQTPVDATEIANGEIIAEQLKDRLGLNLTDLAALPDTERAKTIEAAHANTVEARFAKDNPDLTRSLQDRLRRREYWEQTTPDQLAEVAALTGRLAPHDQRAAEADAIVTEQLSARFAIDLKVLRSEHPDPQAQREALAGSITEAVSEGRDARAVAETRDQTRMVYDRVRRGEFWKQATPEQIADAVTYTNLVAPHDVIGREAADVAKEQMTSRFAIDVDEVLAGHTGPQEQRAAITDALKEHFVTTGQAPGSGDQPTALSAPTPKPSEPVVSTDRAVAGADAAVVRTERTRAANDRQRAAQEQSEADRAPSSAEEIADSTAQPVADDLGATDEVTPAPASPLTGNEPATGAPETVSLQTSSASTEPLGEGHALGDDAELDGRAAQLRAQARTAESVASSHDRPAQAYQRVTEAELSHVPPVAARARRQSATSFAAPTRSGLGARRTAKPRVNTGRKDRGRAQDTARVQDVER